MDLPLEQNTAGQRVAFRQEITQNPRRVTTAYLVSRESKVHTFEDVHEDCWNILNKRPWDKRQGYMLC